MTYMKPNINVISKFSDILASMGQIKIKKSYVLIVLLAIRETKVYTKIKKKITRSGFIL